MNNEDTIRAKHEFNDKVHKLLEHASVMTNLEIEIAIARLSDAIPAHTDKTHIQMVFT